MTKKILFLGIILITAFLIRARHVSAQEQCDIFDFPLIKNGAVIFYNCDLGEMQKFDKQNALVSVPGTKKIGGFVNNFVWSPDGTRALILAENVSAAVQSLEFYSSDREINSLNWWVYDLSSGKAELLDKNIVSIGWSTNNEVIYNWNNENLSVSKLESFALKNTSRLTNILNDSSDINEIISPVNLNGFSVFPMGKGFYAINTGEKEAKYFPLEDGIQNILEDPFDQKYVVIKSGNSLYRFTGFDNSLILIDKNFSASYFSFLDTDSLATVENNGQVFSYDINTQAKSKISLPVSGNVSRVFSAGNKKEFAFVIGDNIYKKNLGSESVLQLGLGADALISPQRRSSPDEMQESAKEEPGTSLAPVEQPQIIQTAPQKKNNVVLLVVGILFLAIGTMLYFIYRKFIKNSKND